MSERPSVLFALDPEHLPLLFPPDLMARLTATADLDPTLVADLDDPASRRLLASTEVLVTGWGCPPLTPETLAAAPRLRAVLHTGGSVKYLLPNEGWERGLLVSSAAAANALPVAEYALGMILLAGKGVLTLADRYRAERRFTLGEVHRDVGNVGRRVGLIGASRIGRRLIELLRHHDLDVVLHDPYVDEADAARLGARLVGVAELFRESHIVSVHAPAVPETHHLVDRAALASMRDGAVLLNTARGSLVDHEALTEELVSGRLSAILDVTEPEPLPADSPLWGLPNVLLTPHIAGSHGNELSRLGRTAVEELERLAAGHPLRHRVHRAELHRAA
ncbi:hydroxyacid dehydrogenase [Streptomyces sp. 3MP-14]|uniref:Hydroxyacid dehydrogenase n=1 Tax=Streptomyces mimosae TaxID=2586635 RepID=A0A5N5ZZI8_9ACTN|nr:MULTISPECIES: hydroxyacid dehydrogenase [Streptomyces]KAB8161907.1 hydroxyacid dehydrogenase [Streptomyces mimosae]KAB8173605.1 hydroxyacid dehydrogenase [Streptomyces sp. 3MP-14]